MANLTEWTFEIDQDVYEEAVKVCEQLGTTIEVMAVSFIKFCVVPENLPLLEAYVNIEKAPDETGASDEIKRIVFEKVYAIARQEMESK